MTNGTPRVVAATVKESRATFNQVTLLQAIEQPNELILVAIDPSAGVYVWRTDPAQIADDVRQQHQGYSEQLGAIDPDDPPPYLGAGEFTPSAEIDDELWERLVTARTNSLKRAAKDFVGVD